MTDSNLVSKWSRSSTLVGDARLAPGAHPIGERGSRFSYREIRSRIAAIVRSTIRNRNLFAVDLVLSAFALLLAAWLRLGPQVLFSDLEAAKSLAGSIPVFVAICAVTFPTAGLYKRKWKFASIPDYIVLLQAILIASLTFMTAIFLYSGFAIIPHSIIAIEIMVLTSLLAGVRITFRQEDLKALAPTSRGTVADPSSQVPVLLVGPGQEADLYLRALQRDRTSTYLPVGFLDDSPAETGAMLRGVPVLGTTDEFEAVIAGLESRKQKPRHLIFTAPLSSFKGETAERLIEQADRMGMVVSRLNPATELRKTHAASAFELRPIELTDLLERPQAALDIAALQRFIRDRRVLVTGAGGSIGSELTRQVAALGPSRLVVVDNSEFNLYSIDLDLAEKFSAVPRSAHLCDIRDVRRLDSIFAQHKPELVFHAAALKHVPMVELNPCEGVLTNVCGTMNVAEAVRRWGAVGMVQISTDKVVNSPNMMGATKRLAELFCQSLDLECANEIAGPRFVTVRFGNVLGSSGSLIPLFKRQLARGGPLTITHPEMKRFFMTIREAVELTLQASAYAVEKKLGSGEIFVLDMGEPIKVIDIARRMIRLAGFTPDRDVQIQIIGRRPGEKLFEELFDESEERVAPPVPGVFGAVPKPVPLPVLYDTFERLHTFASDGNTAAVVDTMRRILPGFRAGESQLQGATIDKSTTDREFQT
ncbi:polysaccharide biosynthesis protein [Mesorhizobium sp. M00.F.Ca.ET.216.01.1.1]|nr:polysaccharide biosynthesis protein [Mesorhizobium sp. M00.F.Ca.ET.216.01.1.1]TJW14874.1 MAG: NAD-dependent epimerase/dehydratase family protein [Mesorhizobium sp.]TJW48932.1 MAG: NAD-dependent epimerase/dehydratase family protein [Mesorhizobium sp.]